MAQGGQAGTTGKGVAYSNTVLCTTGTHTIQPGTGAEPFVYYTRLKFILTLQLVIFIVVKRLLIQLIIFQLYEYLLVIVTRAVVCSAYVHSIRLRH